MTFNEFLKELAKLPKKGWKVRIIWGIPGDSGRIRLAEPNSNTFCHCPVTAVCLAKKKKRFDTGGESLAAAEKTLHLHGRTGTSIETAADQRFPFRPIDRRRRAQMISVLNEQENARY